MYTVIFVSTCVRVIIVVYSSYNWSIQACIVPAESGWKFDLSPLSEGGGSGVVTVISSIFSWAAAAAPVALSLDTPGGSECYKQNIMIRRRARVASRSAFVRQFASPSVLSYIIVVLNIIPYKCYIFILLVILLLPSTVSWSRFVT